MLEAAENSDNAFLTLTYDNEHLPSDGSLDPRHLQLFMKRLRRKWKQKIRFFGCGEYGDITERPHFHIALFGMPSCQNHQTQFSSTGMRCCAICQSIQTLWPYGQIFLGTLTEQSSAYIAGYVTKKMTSKDDARLKGRYPEFARMSLRPGIGAGMMDEVASTLMQHKLDEKLEDVPSTLRHGNKQWPLGRYLKRRLRTRIGRDAKTPESVLRKKQEAMHDMRQSAFASSTPLREKVLEASLGKRIQILAKAKRNRRVGVI